ncbi:MAG: hypothetical protein HZB25_01660 [Candidatus Eisenbacteria bacterium]|nr:hypothetical protein [Candidatus Eisenbacteria bacterium]
MKLVTSVLLGLTLIASSAFAVCGPVPTIDGTLDAIYGAAVSVQNTQTQFGDNSLGVVDYANGSELDNAYGVIVCNSLYLFLGGNLESNFNKLEIFLDTKGGGQNKLRNDNPGVDYNGLNRMGDDGSGNGLMFDTGFEADYWIGVTGGWNGSGYAIYANYAEVLTSGGGLGDYLGTTGAASSGVLSGGTDHGIQLTLNNSNVAGVDGGCSASLGAGVGTGIELAIPLSLIGDPTCLKVCAFINGGGHDYLANQVLGPLPAGTCNLGEPRVVNFGGIAGDQFFLVGCNVTPVSGSTWGGLKRLYK